MSQRPRVPALIGSLKGQDWVILSTFWMQGLSDVHFHTRPQPAAPQNGLEEEAAQTHPQLTQP